MYSSSFMEWISVAYNPCITKYWWRGVKHANTGLWSSGNLFCGVTNPISMFGFCVKTSVDEFGVNELD